MLFAILTCWVNGKVCCVGFVKQRIWQAFKNGQRGVDYDQLGGMISGIKPGGNVYLNGRVVGQVMSEEQGAQYRNLKRSGWQ